MQTQTITYQDRADLAERAPRCPVDAMISAACYLSREWGDYGYSIGYAGPYGTPEHPYLFSCSHADGSRFALIADRYGNVRSLD